MLLWLLYLGAFLFEGGIIWLSIQRYAFLETTSPLLQTGQVSILFAICLLLTPLGLALGRVRPHYAFWVFLAKGLCLAFILMLVPRLDLGCLPFLLAFNLTLGLGLGALGSLVVQGTMVGMALAMSQVFRIQLGVDPTDLPLLLLSAGLLAGCSIAARSLFEQWQRMRDNEKRLATDVGNLININMDLQTFAMTVENQTLDGERKRLSREIHDTVGYTLTTLKLLFEAAKGLIHQDPSQLEPLMDQGATYTRNSLEEIRVAMRGLRESELPVQSGLHLIVKLVNNFRSVTDMAITLEFVGTRPSYGPMIDEFLYRGVQENLTNAYRHGKATKVAIILQENQGVLSLLVTDNGQSSRNFNKGIGMRGMEERVVAVGGKVEFVGTDCGFHVTARIPVPTEENP
jgi:signal transduction histidine kinase